MTGILKDCFIWYAEKRLKAEITTLSHLIIHPDVVNKVLNLLTLLMRQSFFNSY